MALGPGSDYGRRRAEPSTTTGVDGADQANSVVAAPSEEETYAGLREIRQATVFGSPGPDGFRALLIDDLSIPFWALFMFCFCPRTEH